VMATIVPDAIDVPVIYKVATIWRLTTVTYPTTEILGCNTGCSVNGSCTFCRKL
jgi:hypothetical protein